MNMTQFDSGKATATNRSFGSQILEHDEEPGIEPTPGGRTPDSLLVQDDIELAILEINAVDSDYYHTDHLTYLKLVGGEIGTVSPSELAQQDGESIVRLLVRHQELTGAFDGIDIDVESIREERTGITAEFRHRINGVPVDVSGRVKYDEDGEVLQISSLIVNPVSVAVTPSVQKDEAVIHAIDAVSNEHGRVPSNVTVQLVDLAAEDRSNPTLWYGFADQDSAPHAYWTISMTFNDGHYYAFEAIVNAQTGETTVQNRARN